MSRRLPMSVTLLAALCAGLLGAAVGPPVLVLGDSYASGEGLASAQGACGTDDERSWGALLASARGSASENVACSGAEVSDITVGGPLGLPAQLATAAGTTPVQLAVITVGGNDLGFVDIVADCLGFPELDGPQAGAPGATTQAQPSGAWSALVTDGVRDGGCDVTEAELLERVADLTDVEAFALPDGGAGSLGAVYAATAEQVLTDTGELVVVGYPQLFAPPDEWLPRYGRRCHGLRARDAVELANVVDALDVVVAAEVAAANALLGEDRVRHVSLLGAWEAAGHHGLCGAAEPWMNGLTVVEGGVDVSALLGQLSAGGELDAEQLGIRPGGSFHPNTAGHVAISGIVDDALDGGG